MVSRPDARHKEDGCKNRFSRTVFRKCEKQEGVTSNHQRHSGPYIQSHAYSYGQLRIQVFRSNTEVGYRIRALLE